MTLFIFFYTCSRPLTFILFLLCIQAQIDVLSALEKRYEDLGPVYDCVVFKATDGLWRACLCGADENLKDVKLLSPFKDSNEFATFSADDMLNYSINVHDEGNLLEVVANAGSHGTHVSFDVWNLDNKPIQKWADVSILIRRSGCRHRRRIFPGR